MKQLTYEQLRVEFLKSNQAYVLATLKLHPSKYMNEPSYILIRQRIDELMEELKKRREL